jgi:hypothetical protein
MKFVIFFFPRAITKIPPSPDFPATHHTLPAAEAAGTAAVAYQPSAKQKKYYGEGINEVEEF